MDPNRHSQTSLSTILGQSAKELLAVSLALSALQDVLSKLLQDPNVDISAADISALQGVDRAQQTVHQLAQLIDAVASESNPILITRQTVEQAVQLRHLRDVLTSDQNLPPTDDHQEIFSTL